MAYVNISLSLQQGDADRVGDALLDAGALSINIEDADVGTQHERPVFAEPGADIGLWNLCRLTAMFGTDVNARSLLDVVLADCGVCATKIASEPIEDTDWVRQNQEQFQPIRISEKLWIVPSWHSDPDPDAINIQLDPGAAFGTGSHPTTRLCLQWLETRVTKSESLSVLDYGCGSGILAIAAMKLGARSCTGIDIDAQAIDTAKFNALKNDVEVSFQTAEQAVPVHADVTVANILANPLKVLAPLLAAKTKIGGSVALAGLLDLQADEIISIYRPWFDLSVWKSHDGWSCLAGERRNR